MLLLLSETQKVSLTGFSIRASTVTFRFRSELGDIVEELTPKLSAVIAACERIIDNQSLTEFLGFTLQTGNFINTVLRRKFRAFY